MCLWSLRRTLKSYDSLKLIPNVLNNSEILSGRPGSNRRHSAWKADALPTELLPHYYLNYFLGLQM